MDIWCLVLIIFIIVPIGLWLFSFLTEAIRSKPKPPQQLRWSAEIPIKYIEVDNIQLRYVKAGSGPALVLLHTLRTQLDLFEKVIDELSKIFTVYAVDYPGHGYSDIPKAKYDADFFADKIEGFFDSLDIKDATIAGVSIGGSLSLILAGRQNKRVSRVVAINPYDYAKGRGIARSSLLARMIMLTAPLPFIGETIMRLRNFLIMKAVFRGGVADHKSIPYPLLREMDLVGNRPGHYRAFLSLLRNAASWEMATKIYSNINVPVLLIWGSEDWAYQHEREHDKSIIPNAEMIEVENGGHFLALDRPDGVISHITRFYDQTASS